MADSAFLKEFDDLLAQVLTDYGNLDSAPDTTAGSITYIKAACLASCLWGIYRYQDYLSKQIFVDTADTENLNHWGAIYGITRTTVDTDSTYLQKILDFLRQPPAGGNKLDYETWAKEVPGVTGAGFTGILHVDTATVITPDDGLDPGNVSITITPDDDGQYGSTGMQDLVNQTYTYVDGKRPVTANQLSVQAPALLYVNVTMACHAPTGVTLDLQVIRDDVTAFFDSLNPGDSVYKTKLASIAIQDGAENATISLPTLDIIISKYFLCKLGSLTVSQI
jgi:uncharacterized phage protein gp47/JayE